MITKTFFHFVITIWNWSHGLTLYNIVICSSHFVLMSVDTLSCSQFACHGFLECISKDIFELAFFFLLFFLFFMDILCHNYWKANLHKDTNFRFFNTFSCVFFYELGNRHSKHATMQLSLRILTSFIGLVATIVHGNAEAFVWELFVSCNHNLVPKH
jgi:hypothetical protein